MSIYTEAEIDDAVFRFVEHELYNYEETKKELQEMNLNDIESNVMGNIGVYDNYSNTPKYNKGSSTEDAAINLIGNKIAKRMYKTVLDITKAKKKIGPEKRELFELKYIKGRTRQQICSEISISPRTYYRWRHEIVCIVAEEMGLLDIKTQ